MRQAALPGEDCRGAGSGIRLYPPYLSGRLPGSAALRNCPIVKLTRHE